MPESKTIISCENITKRFALKESFFGGNRILTALDSVSLEIKENETLGLVGESGSGKSTLGRIFLRLIDPDSGTIKFRGADITKLEGRRLRPFRKHVQAVFQDPFSSLNPRQRIVDILSEPLNIHTALTTAEKHDSVAHALEQVGLPPDEMNKYPHEFSGGQRQRINIARALILKPSFIVADEPVSSLDVSIQAQILNLFMDLKAQYKFSTLFISHDLRIVRHISDRIAVISNGRIVETGTVNEVFEHTKHLYTKTLINSLPEKNPQYQT